MAKKRVKKKAETTMPEAAETKNFLETDFCPVDFETNGKIYRYDFSYLTIIQAEYAKEIGLFKHAQQQREADTFHEKIRSGGIGWNITALSYLVTPVESKEEVRPQLFDEGQVKKIEADLKIMPIELLRQVEDCVSHFFTSIGKEELLSSISQGKKHSPFRQTLLEAFTKSMTANQPSGD